MDASGFLFSAAGHLAEPRFDKGRKEKEEKDSLYEVQFTAMAGGWEVSTIPRQTWLS
jgi:hypothetical protein